MKTLILLLFLGIVLHEAAARTHSLKYFYTASSHVPNFPEFVSVGLVDDVQISHYDSNTMKTEAKQEWMNKAIEEDPQYWDRQSQTGQGHQQTFKANIETAKQRFNQTGGVHIFQVMYGCEWDDETGQVDGYRQFGYDGEDFLVWDTKTNTWITPKQQGFATINKWNGNPAQLEIRKAYLTKRCPDWLKKYVEYGKNSLMRTERPTVSFLQKSPSAPVTCHATGFFPQGAAMHWKKDGVETHDNVVMGEILPNNDGTFQMSIDLSSVKFDDNTKYECVFQLSGDDEDIVRELKKEGIMSNEKTTSMTIIIVVAVVVLCAVIIAGVGFFIYKKRGDKRPPSPVSDPEVEQELNPKPE